MMIEREVNKFQEEEKGRIVETSGNAQERGDIMQAFMLPY
jgi:hypothetical protein